ncbi:hypothetical protein JCM11251_002018 [Rhodosporidiobolus azoricus]
MSTTVLRRSSSAVNLTPNVHILPLRRHSSTSLHFPSLQPQRFRHLRPRSFLRTILACITAVVIVVVALVQYAPDTHSHLRPTGSRSGSATSLICPSPSTGRPEKTFSTLSAFSPFTRLDSSQSSFILSLSYSTKHCNAFRLRVTRKERSYCQSTLPELNEDESTSRFVEGLGPDTFQLQVDGAERLVVEQPALYDAEECAYEYHVALTNSGAVWLQVTHLYEHYNAYISTPEHEVPRLITPLLETPLQLSLCDSSCSAYVPPLLSKRASLFRAETTDSPSLAPASSLPACTGPKPISGSYIPSALPSLLYPPHQLPMTPSRPSAGYHTFVPSGCSFQHDGLRFRDHASCLRKKRSTLFLGDSHARGVYDVMAHRLRGNDEMALTSFKVANKAEDIEKLHLVSCSPSNPDDLTHTYAVLFFAPPRDLQEFLWDPYLKSTPSCNYLSSFDSIVISAGSHSACYNCPPTAKYLAEMQKVFTEWPALINECRDAESTRALIKREEGTSGRARREEEDRKRVEDDEYVAFLARPFRFIFVTSPAWYPQAIEKYDCRTAQRLGRWNSLASSAALEAGWSVVDAEALTKPMQQDTRIMDGVHYIKTDAIDPMVDEVVEKLGICGNESPKRV